MEYECFTGCIFYQAEDDLQLGSREPEGDIYRSQVPHLLEVLPCETGAYLIEVVNGWIRGLHEWPGSGRNLDTTHTATDQIKIYREWFFL